MGWTSNWLYTNDEPSVTWRGAQSIPRTLTLRRGRDGLRLVQAPVAELERLRTAPAPTVDHRHHRPARVGRDSSWM